MIINLKKEITLITHDYFLICDKPQPYYYELDDCITKNNNCNLLLEKCDKIIVQNTSNIHVFSKYFKNKKIIVSPLPDYKKKHKKINFDYTDKIKIAVIGCIHEIKGKLFLDFIIEIIKNQKLNIEIVFLGSININYSNQYDYSSIDEFNDLLELHKPNLILETSIWPETYSYTLTLSMLTDLPILILNKKFNSTVKNRLLSYKKNFLFNTLDDFFELVNTKKQNYLFTIQPIIYFNLFWDDYFLTNKNIIQQNNMDIFKNNLNIFPIYFPQFHTIQENNISFYEDYSDIKNLMILKDNNNIDFFESPNLEVYNLKHTNEYDLTNLDIVQKQIDIIKLYNFTGFALYYYWFDINTITNKNHIMKECVDIFFQNKINLNGRKIFFIWANENWSGNPAFGNLNHKIENDYKNFDKNIEYLIEYFKNPNYYKENNKPVFYIYHPWFIEEEKLQEFKNKLNFLCVKNGFDGVKIYLNNFNNTYIDYDNFYINFNYKNNLFRKNINNQYYLDYEEYINSEHNFNKCSQTIVFDFDNRARLIKPDKINLSTICFNNTDYNKKKFIDKISNLYNSSSNNILLINAWNEWGEKMTIEPSKQYGFYYLNMLYNKLILLNDEIIKSHPTLFHKYNYNLSRVNDEIQIEVFNKKKITNEFITHIHCYDLNLFINYFSNIIENCLLETDVLVTFSIENESIIKQYDNIIFLKINNKGYDIGGKICCFKYLYDNNVNFTNIFLLHSKSDDNKRNMYMSPLVKNVEQIQYIKKLLKEKQNIYAVFPDLLIDTNEEEYKTYLNGTIEYRNEILDFLKCNNKTNLFIEGNIMVLNKKIIDYLFYGKIYIFYNLLNDIDSIDLNWMKYKYYTNKNNPNVTLEEVLNNYLNNKNNYITNDFKALSIKNESLRDCMIEHVFERIWINIILELQGEYIKINK
jgi:hypothetical protein